MRRSASRPVEATPGLTDDDTLLQSLRDGDERVFAASASRACSSGTRPVAMLSSFGSQFRRRRYSEGRDVRQHAMAEFIRLLRGPLEARQIPSQVLGLVPVVPMPGLIVRPARRMRLGIQAMCWMGRLG